MTDTYRGLFTRVVYTEWIFFGLLAVGILKLRRRPNYEPRFRVPASSLVIGVFTLACGVIVVNQLLADTVNAVIGLGAVAIGLPVYTYVVRAGRGRAIPEKQS